MRSTSRRLRDPAWLGHVPPDVWLCGALVACAFLVRRAPAISGLVGILMLCGWATAAWFPLGNTRYAYPMIPVYFLVIGVAASIRFHAAGPHVHGDGPARRASIPA